MGAPDAILALLRRFEQHRDEYRSGRYNETQLRRDFLDPFFAALGWDVHNELEYAETYREVIHEDVVKVGVFTKAPDYSFRVGGVRKFFVEAKKPSISIKDDPAPAYQVRRYAWSAKLPLSIVTDFDELAVYDCRVKPDPADKPSAARVLYLTCDEYPARWEEIAGIFSKEAVLKGSFDKYADSHRAKRGTAAVDDAFLTDIERWRDLLARSIALRNPALSTQELNEAVTRTIDRIIFLRICEDRRIEDYGALQALLNGGETYGRLKELYRKADARYNSGLFHFRHEKGRAGAPDALTLALAIDDKVLKEIIRGLYYPESPYEFSVLPAEILGQVYEQFLGKVIRLTEGHRAVVEEKPEVKKAGGVYYTPSYIVDYIVKSTVGPLLAGKTPKQVEKLRVLDPACGSGSFLLGAYQHLLDWHLDWYTKHEPEKWAQGKRPALYEASHAPLASLAPRAGRGQGEGARAWHLTTAERKRILLNNIFGVDIDSQAVEVTKLSLLLKVLEGETGETLNRQLSFLHERALPDLAANIKCGNSLIGPDYLAMPLLPPFAKGGTGGISDEDLARVNPFDWQREFPEVFHTALPSPRKRGEGQGEGIGGFDAVIGNPPYIRMESFKPLKDYLKSGYASHDERSDLYAYFVEQGHRLLRPDGRFGMIVSNKFLKAGYGAPLRNFLSSASGIEAIVDFAGLPVFKGATVRAIVLLTRKTGKDGAPLGTTYLAPPANDLFRQIASGSVTVQEVVEAQAITLPRSSLAGREWILLDGPQQDLLEKLASGSRPLDEVVNGQVLWGVKTGLNEAFVIDGERRRSILAEDASAKSSIKPFVFGEDVRRYYVRQTDRHLIYTYHGFDIREHPSIEKHLLRFRDQLKNRATKQEWYELQQPSVALAPVFAGPKIIFPIIAPECRFALDDEGRYSNDKTFVLPTSDLSLLGLRGRMA